MLWDRDASSVGETGTRIAGARDGLHRALGGTQGDQTGTGPHIGVSSVLSNSLHSHSDARLQVAGLWPGRIMGGQLPPLHASSPRLDARDPWGPRPSCRQEGA